MTTSLKPRILLPVLLCFVLGCDDRPPAPAPSPPPRSTFNPAVIRVVGSGAMTPLASRLARAWQTQSANPKVVVEPSVGSSGGIRATLDGAVDIGMIARPLSSAEAHLGLLPIPVALDAVVLAAHQDLPVDNLSSAELESLFSGASSQLSDGSPVTVLLRDRSDSAHSAFEKQVPSLRSLREDAFESHRFRVVFHDDAMGATLAASPGAIGVFSLGAVVSWKLPLKVPAIDGVNPSLEHMRDGSWRATRELAFVVRSDNRARYSSFFAFLASEEALAVIRASGYLPLKDIQR